MTGASMAGAATSKRKTAKQPGLGRPSAPQRRWLERGLTQAGGKLPLFDDQGRRVDGRIIRICLERGWVEPWFANPLKPNWLVCKLTDAGRAALARSGKAAVTPRTA
ncbi:hypothetical protein [Rhodospirillum rubrum]|uniref:Uncharacterized protein n=1 Tax=Rhodospirillum rubrum (strain ATCC 11170 / ATH 1.1.1 / DSM 467 / LMG 4362 / NCIMB 8255 / S1) TaxID=269796 RepID=Q2RTS3_RHORT|nr:hypothetical protein [Rhodospirillum rubrum]ABC22472.1 hypothetical protein Rru_A1672 [Rhodospirillum rubrum ATCC 11170]MBK5954055.1 hypothetical protein [Rhodospirillum rubrum]HAQ00383.1 hypothetical protein [Rhodospirillum rubrum]HCF19122.1 hypothetical protein [Rhodospirillum rubrum]